jgi:hypothetical protein
MADALDLLIAGGPGRVDTFTPIAGLFDRYTKGRQDRIAFDRAEAFKDGLPTAADGSVDFDAMGRRMFKLGDLQSGINLANLGLSRDALRIGTAPDPVVSGIVGGGNAPGFSSGGSDMITGAPAAPLKITPSQFDGTIANTASKYGLDANLFRRQLVQESSLNPNAVSPAGAQGIAQFIPATAKRYGVDVKDPNSSIEGAARYMVDLQKQFGGNTGLALAGYNWGEGNVEKWIASGADPSKVPAETRNYVQQITGKPIEAWVRQSGNVAQPASGSDLVGGRWTPQQALQIADQLEARGVQFLGAPQFKDKGQAYINWAKQLRDQAQAITNPTYGFSMTPEGTMVRTNPRNGVAEPVYESNKPVAVKPGESLVNPRNGTVVFANANGMLTSASLQQMAGQYLAGDHSVLQNLGRGSQGPENLAAFWNTVETQAKAKGMSPEQIASAKKEYDAYGAGLTELSKRSAKIETAILEADQMAPVVLEKSAQLDRSQYPTLNRAWLAWKKGTGDENTVELMSSLNTFINIYARAVTGQNPTVSDKDHARELLEPYWSKGQLAAGVALMRREMDLAKKSPDLAKERFKKGFLGGGDARVEPTTQSPGSTQGGQLKLAPGMRVIQGGVTFEIQPDGSAKAVQ